MATGRTARKGRPRSVTEEAAEATGRMFVIGPEADGRADTLARYMRAKGIKCDRSSVVNILLERIPEAALASLFFAPRPDNRTGQTYDGT